MDEQKYYNEIWKRLDNWKKPGGAYRIKDSDPEITEFIRTIKKGTVLDIGCGGGRNIIPFAEAGFKVTGTDFSPEAIKLAKVLAEENNVEINFLLDDILNTKLKEKFDIITDAGCFHHLRKEEQLKYIKTLKKLSKPSTIIRILVINNLCKKIRSHNYKQGQAHTLKEGHYTKYFSEEELKELFKDYNININRIDRGHTKSFYEVILTNH
jgi:2-polyprenyl-3-methyl-5-hydroxy-6-metoxy-1,4-benzoquinol methylase